MRLLVLSSISGLLSFLSVVLPHTLPDRYAMSDDILFFLPGVLFFIFVVFPIVRRKKKGVIRIVALFLVTLAAWYAAVSAGFILLPLVKQIPFWACAMSGSIGVAILAIACRYLVGFRFTATEYLLSLMCGFIGGAIIGMGVQAVRASIAGEIYYFCGFLFWHCSVALSLFWSHYRQREPN